MWRLSVTVALLAMSASPLASKVDCGQPFISFVQKINEKPIPGSELAAVHRHALRIFDACDTGHLLDPDVRLRQLERLYTPQ